MEKSDKVKWSPEVDRQGIGDSDSKAENPGLMGYIVVLGFAASRALTH